MVHVHIVCTVHISKHFNYGSLHTVKVKLTIKDPNNALCFYDNRGRLSVRTWCGAFSVGHRLKPYREPWKKTR